MVAKAFDPIRSVAMFGEIGDRKFALGATAIRRAADQHRGSIPVVEQFGGFEDSRSIEVAGQNENEIGGLGSFREYQKVSEIRQCGLPADGGEQEGEQDEGE